MVDGSRSGAFWLLLSLLITFLIVRGITQRIRSENEGLLRDVTLGGIHIHHLVYGIGITLVAGFLEFRFQPGAPWFELLAIAFGIGAGLMLDEFALPLHEGRLLGRPGTDVGGRRAHRAHGRRAVRDRHHPPSSTTPATGRASASP